MGSRVDDVYGTTIGRVADVWTEEDTGRPRWLVIRGGRFGGHYTLIPFEDASGGPNDVWVSHERATIRRAPTVSPTEPLSAELEARLERHYSEARIEITPVTAPATPLRAAGFVHRLGGSRLRRD